MRFAELKQLLGHIKNDNETRTRSFTTEADLMALYRKLWERGEWGEFFHHAKCPFELVALCPDESGTDYDCYESDLTAWLFCLSGSGYEERCEMVGKYLRGRK